MMTALIILAAVTISVGCGIVLAWVITTGM